MATSRFAVRRTRGSAAVPTGPRRRPATDGPSMVLFSYRWAIDSCTKASRTENTSTA